MCCSIESIEVRDAICDRTTQVVSFPKIKANGYVAVESAPHHQFSEDVRQTLKKLCLQYGLKLVYQIHTDDYSQYPKKEKTVEGHLKRFKDQLEDAQRNFGDILLFVNSHSGYDGWVQQQQEQFFSAALEIEKKITFCGHARDSSVPCVVQSLGDARIG